VAQSTTNPTLAPVTFSSKMGLSRRGTARSAMFDPSDIMNLVMEIPNVDKTRECLANLRVREIGGGTVGELDRSDISAQEEFLPFNTRVDSILGEDIVYKGLLAECFRHEETHSLLVVACRQVSDGDGKEVGRGWRAHIHDWQFLTVDGELAFFHSAEVLIVVLILLDM
jgi:hypothetical protein